MNQDPNMINETKLSNEAVMSVLGRCVSDSENGVVARMFGSDYALNVRGEEEKIMSLLLQLPREFISTTGAGHSLIGAVFNKDGEIWARDYAMAQHLLALGKAAGIVEEVFPVSMRAMLPEKVPYYRVNIG